MTKLVKPVHNEADYEAALAEYEMFFDREPDPGSDEGDRFELLGLVLAKYEEDHFPFRAPEPVATIRLVMEGRGYSQSDLASVLGSAPRASEILKGTRPLSMDHIRKLHKAWSIPTDALIGELADA